ncbi:MAG: prephenate dehydratase domain-containing protein [Verrucomicrobiota bacterium]
MSAALALEENLQIAYLGPVGTWTHQAAVEKFGHSVGFLPQKSLAEVFNEVTHGAADYGVVPIENSTEGAARDIYRLFAAHPLHICAEINQPAHISILGQRDIKNAERIYGHPAMIAAIGGWLTTQKPLESIECSSTSAAGEHARDDAKAVAVGNPLIAELYGLQELASEIEDEPATARFSVVGRRNCPPTEDDLTILTIDGKEMGNNLMEALEIFRDADIEVLRIDGHDEGSFSETSGRSVIRVETRGHAEVAPLSDAIDALRVQGKIVTVLGSFPRLSQLI